MLSIFARISRSPHTRASFANIWVEPCGSHLDPWPGRSVSRLAMFQVRQGGNLTDTGKAAANDDSADLKSRGNVVS